MATPSSITSAPAEKAANDARLLPALRSLAEVGGGPAHRVFQQLFQLVLQEFEPLVARRDFRSGALTSSELRHRSSLRSDDAQRLAEEYINAGLLEVQCSGSTGPRVTCHEIGTTLLHVICVPVMDLQSGEPEGAIGVLIDGSRETAATVAQQLTILVTVATSLCESSAAGQFGNTADQADRDQQLEGFARASSFGTVREFAYTLVNSLCSKFRCEQVAFGIVTRQRVDVLAVSGLAVIKANSPGVIPIRQAMEECVDHKSVLGWQATLQTTDAMGQAEEICSPGLLHRQWAHECNDSSVVSLPLHLDGQVIGAVSLRRDDRHPFSRAERIRLEQLCGQFASPIQLIEAASRPIAKQITAAMAGSAKACFRRGAWGRWAALLTLIAGVSWFSLGATQFHPRCSCEVAPETTFHFTAPFQSQLKVVHVQAGEEVQAGQLLAEFETRELQLEFESLAADLTAREVDVRKALQDNDVEKAALYQAQADVLRAQALAVENRLRRARLVAPADGWIIQCDSRQLTGQVLAQGDPVLQFAPHGGFVLKLQVPDAIATSVRPGQTGVFASAARPDISLPFRIRQMNSAAEVVDGANVFVAEADLVTSSEWLKVGMQGNVRIDSSMRPVWWVATHSMINWLRMRFWL